MKKLFVYTIMTLLITSFAMSQGKMHVVYILHDNNTDVIKLDSKIKSSIEKFGNDNFVLYYSDATPLVMDKSNYDKEKLSRTIFGNMSTYSITPRQEVDGLSNLFERSYKGGEVVLDFFVTDDFFDNNYQNSVVAHFLIDNGLHNSQSASVVFHICGGKVNNNAVSFNEAYNVKNKTEIK